MMTSRVTCFYPECQNDKATNCSKCFFKIPKELIRCRLWLKAMGKSELIGKADKLHRNTRICADHFNESDFTSTLRTRLLPSAVPRDFIKRNPSVLQSEITTERSKEKRNLETADASTSESSSFPEITTERSKEKRNLEMADASTPQYSSFPVKDFFRAEGPWSIGKHVSRRFVWNYGRDHIATEDVCRSCGRNVWKCVFQWTTALQPGRNL